MSVVKYRKISTRICNDAKFMRLSDDAQFIFIWLLVHPMMTCMGAMRGSVQGLAAEKKWLPERFAKGLEELSINGMVNYDETAFAIVLPNFIKHNRPENPNVVKGWRSAFNDMPECEIILQHYQRLKDFLETEEKRFAEPFAKPFMEGFSKPVTVTVTVTVTDKHTSSKNKKTENHFDKFWTAYPKKVGKANSLKIWKDNGLDEFYQLIVSAVENKKIVEGTEIQFWKDPERYLKYRRWEDAVIPKPTSPEANVSAFAKSDRSFAEMRADAERKKPASASLNGQPRLDRFGAGAIEGHFSPVARIGGRDDGAE